MINTHFSLYFGDNDEMIVTKALCSYQNGGMNSVGPTLEIIEAAKEWQRHGLGDALMRAIKCFYCTKFESHHSRILFSVCQVTNMYAGKWFMRIHHFRDLDGMGDELGKYLNTDEDESEDDDGDGDY